MTHGMVKATAASWLAGIPGQFDLMEVSQALFYLLAALHLAARVARITNPSHISPATAPSRTSALCHDGRF